MTSQMGSVGKVVGVLIALCAFSACGSNGGDDTLPPSPRDSTPPTVSSTIPTNNAAEVPVNTALTVTFSEPMNPATLNTASFTVKDSGNNPIGGIVSYSGTTATFTPNANLVNPSTYTATITTDAQDLAGNAISQAFVWSFATGAGEPGWLDTSFGKSGVVTTSVTPFNDWATAIGVQPDGKIVAAGATSSGLGSFVGRYHPDGTLDKTFGNGGTGTIFSAVNGTTALAIQSDGKIIVAGGQPVGTHYDFAVARYNPDGTIDAGFGSSGLSVTPISNTYDDIARAVSIQTDGKIVAAGYVSDSNLSYNNLSPNYDFALVRYTPNGTLDAGFGSGGKVITDIGANRHDDARGLGIQIDGKIVVAGWSINNPGSGNPNNDFALVRYNQDGSLDVGFGTGGTVISDLGSTVDQANALVIQSDGTIVVAGGAHGADFAVARYTTSGSLDMSFGNSGVTITPVSADTDLATAVRLQSNGKIVAAGISETGGNYDFALVRYNQNGSLDANFGSGGTVISDLGSTSDQAYALAIQSDGKIVTAGKTAISGKDFIAVARYWP